MIFESKCNHHNGSTTTSPSQPHYVALYLGHKQQSRLNFSEDYVNFELRQTGREWVRGRERESEGEAESKKNEQKQIKSTCRGVKDVKLCNF